MPLSIFHQLFSAQRFQLKKQTQPHGADFADKAGKHVEGDYECVLMVAAQIRFEW
jgi:hypothetical protein